MSEDRLKELRAEVARRMAIAREQQALTHYTPEPPRYDDVFFAGMEWLSSNGDSS